MTNQLENGYIGYENNGIRETDRDCSHENANILYRPGEEQAGFGDRTGYR
ncbi:hypothetical protein U0X36_04910 [Bacillus thuringiensis]|nr:hypothetical protein [Bacillus thuringiensis]MDZ3952293.1 hypothetical protein [Bacillus thuringiensis]